MKIRLFYHSLLSDWNHGNAHFLRGVASELISRGHDLRIYEPRDGWSLTNLRRECGEKPIKEFRRAYPQLDSIAYDPASLDLDDALDEADLVIVHEWNERKLVDRIGRHHSARGRYVLLFHDTHHRAATDPAAMAAYNLAHYDGVLAFGAVLRQLYLVNRWTRRAWIWHEAADTRVFRPITNQPSDGDLVWIGNWGDEERAAELQEYLLEPVQALGLRARVHGVRYPRHALAALTRAGIESGGWLPNHRAPEVFARYRLTVHVPRRPYVQALRGIPTIRVFEALACGMPLVCSPWDDAEGLFHPGKDYVVAGSGRQMRRQLATLLAEKELARQLAAHGHRTILSRHTCAHRVDELMEIVAEIQNDARPVQSPMGNRRRRTKAACGVMTASVSRN